MLRHPFGRPTYSARTDPRGKSSNTPLQKMFVAFLYVGGFLTYLSSTKREGLGKLREKDSRCHTIDNRVMPQVRFTMLDIYGIRLLSRHMKRFHTLLMETM